MIASNPGDYEGYADFNPEERKEFYKKAQTMCGPTLAKTLTESVTMSRIRRISECLVEEGDFVEIEELKEIMKDMSTHFER